MGSGKQISQREAKKQKRVVSEATKTDQLTPVWLFDWLDRSGTFSFDLSRPDFNHREFLEKMIQYSNVTWAIIKQQTHDAGKSKHHYLPYEKLSPQAQERIKAKHLEQYTDAIFSFSFRNLLRVIGVRDGAKFHVIWYDPQHQFYPVKK